jgi:hypothetical protein
MPERTLLDMIIDRLEAGLPVTVYVLDPAGTVPPRSASAPLSTTPTAPPETPT